jgi:serine/threonine-protein kinase
MQKELGQGACGKTVLLYDDLIKKHFVCKKYVPYAESERQVLYANFVREIQLLHEIYHPNVVRVFNYYLYPEQYSGYILMEYVDGIDVEEYLKANPETINEIFLQAIAGFRYLESCGILHRDIRPGNILVRNDGMLKIIDLGFGKRIETPEDFDKSITLNWWCERPAEFANSVYDFKSELYFLGKLFEKIIQENEIEHFKYQSILARMCVNDHSRRMDSFQDAERKMQSDRFYEIEFTEDELSEYRIFADALCSHIAKIKDGTKYINDPAEVQKRLESAYRTFMLEEYVPNVVEVTRCFLNGSYQYRKQDFRVYPIKGFIHLLKSTSEEKKKIIMANIQTRLNAIEHYEEKKADSEDDIPF